MAKAADKLPTGLVGVGALKGPHGLKGMVKANIKLDDFDLLVDAGPLLTKDGRALKVTKWQAVGQGLLALAIEGVTSVEGAEALRGLAVHLERGNFPELDGEVFIDELVGRDVVGPDGKVMGKVQGVTDLPAGPAVEVLVGVDVKVLPLVPDFVEIGETLALTELGVAVLQV